MNRQKQIAQFAKLCEYIIGRNPDEFGLVPDNDGYIKIKEFLQAVTEIDGWRNVRISTLNEMRLVHPDPPVEIDDTRIRAKDLSRLPQITLCENPPKLLYVCITEKSYPAVLENGIRPTVHSRIICCRDPEMATTIGNRRTPQPVLLTIHTAKLREQGLLLWNAGERLFLADFIPPDAFTGPVLPKEATTGKKPEKKPDPVEIYRRQSQAGTFSLSIGNKTEKKHPGRKKEKDLSWKNNKKHLRREKKYAWPDQ